MICMKSQIKSLQTDRQRQHLNSRVKKAEK